MQIFDPKRGHDVEIPTPGPLGSCHLDDYGRRARELAREAALLQPIDPDRAAGLVTAAASLEVTARDLEAEFVNRFRC